MEDFGIIDIHTHAFPDAIVEKAMAALLAEAEVTAYLDGRLSSLLRSMDTAGIEKSVICSIATRPKQFDPIFNWSQQIRSDRIIPLPSVHPADDDFAEKIRKVKKSGFSGLKMHPYYQDFYLDDDRLMQIYQVIAEEGLILVMHTGYDIAFERIDRCGPARIAKVCEKIPDLKLITTHMASWQDWDNVEKYIIGKDIMLEISFSLDYLQPARAKDMILRHGPENVFFGTDSPWKDQSETIKLLKNLDLGKKAEKQILRQNAVKLLGLTP